MTVKVTTANHPSPHNTSCGYAVNAGSFYSKIQNGSNSSRVNGKLVLSQNPYSMELVYKRDNYCDWRQAPDGTINTGTVESCFGGVSLTPAYPSMDLQYENAIRKLARQARQHSFNAPVFFATANKTVAGIADTAYKLARTVSLFKRGRVQEAVRTLVGKQETGRGLKRFDPRVNRYGFATDETIARNILELQYHWRPLISDTVAAAGLLARSLDIGIPLRTRFSRTFRQSVDLKNAYNETLGTARKSRRIVWTLDDLVTTGTGVLKQEFDYTFSVYGVGEAAWETFPFTFVFDWALPVGQWLETLNIVHSLKGTYTDSTFETGYVEGFKFGPYVIEGTDYRHYLVKVNRVVGDIASTAVPPPRWKNPLTFEHALNGIALLRAVGSRFAR